MVKRSKIVVFLVFSIFLLFSCFDKKAKINYSGSKKISENLYLEFYTPIKGGVLANDLSTVHLTDSNSVEIFLFDMDDHETFDYEIDSIYFKAIKYSYIFQGYNKPSKQISIDSIIIDLKTFKIVEK